jgi:hypothetical protein
MGGIVANLGNEQARRPAHPESFRTLEFKVKVSVSLETMCASLATVSKASPRG